MAKDFTGDTPELGEVMNLSSEKLDNGMAFGKFLEKLKNIYAKYIRHAEDVMYITMDLEDSTSVFESKHIPKDLTEEEEKKTSKHKMLEMRLTTFLDREEVMAENINKIYALAI